MLHTLASQVHVKLKYHNVNNEPVIINVDLIGDKRIYQTQQQNQRESKATTVEINVVLLIN